MGFEVHQKQQVGRQVAVPTVRFMSDKVQFNVAAIDLLAGELWLQLLHDPDSGQVAFRPSDAADPNAHKVTYARSMATLTTRGFIEKAGVGYKRFRLSARDGMYFTEEQLGV